MMTAVSPRPARKVTFVLFCVIRGLIFGVELKAIHELIRT